MPYDVVGPVCESTDVLAHAKSLPKNLAEGDLLVIDGAGAYGWVMASHYNARDIPAEYVVPLDSQGAELSRAARLPFT